jgi:hypothetical protein
MQNGFAPNAKQEMPIFNYCAEYHLMSCAKHMAKRLMQYFVK